MLSMQLSLAFTSKFNKHTQKKCMLPYDKNWLSKWHFTPAVSLPLSPHYQWLRFVFFKLEIFPNIAREAWATLQLKERKCMSSHWKQCDCYLYTLFATFAHLSCYENMIVQRKKAYFHTNIKKKGKQPQVSVLPYPYHTLGYYRVL